MLELLGYQKMLNTESVGMLMICLHTKRQMPKSNSSLVTDVKRTAKSYRFCIAAILLSYTIQIALKSFTSFEDELSQNDSTSVPALVIPIS
jgi:hypothetical protein